MIRVSGIKADAVHAYRNEQGFRTLEIDGWPQLLLAGAFESDIQTVATAQEVSYMLDSVVEGWDEIRSFSGNSSTVTMYRDRVTIECDVLEDEEPFEMSVDQYRLILDAWTACLVRLRQAACPPEPVPNADKS